MKLFLPLAALVVAAAATTLREEGFLRREFELFERKFNKKYHGIAARERAFNTFSDNLAKVQDHNLAPSTWTEGVTKFFDLTEAEFRNTLNGYINLKKDGVPTRRSESNIDLSALAESVDWRELGAVTEVKDQGGCGSCWAFAAVENIESYVAINNGSLMELSAQQLTSCTPNELECGGTGGCSGLIPQISWTYTQLFGIVSDADWPYLSGATGLTGTCRDSSAMTKAATVRGYELLPRNDYAAVMNHLANVGPLAVAVDASRWGFYNGGVFSGCDYTKNMNINHAVQMVGYGTDEVDGDYWIVRNSWGSSWGEGGFIRLARSAEVECGVDSTPLSGTACVNDGNSQQYVCGQCAVLFDVLYPIGATAL